MMVTRTEACPGPPIAPPIASTAPTIVVIDDDDGVAGAGAGAAALCSVCGTADISCVNPDWVLVPADVPRAWATAGPWPADPAGLVVCGGSVNGVNWVASAAESAYPYIAVASWAHMSAYCASVATIAGVFWPYRFPSTSHASWLRLAAITGGGALAPKAG